MTEYLISGLPVATPGALPLRNSVLARCEECGGGVYIGQQQQAARETLTRRERPFVVLCLLCAASVDSDDD